MCVCNVHPSQTFGPGFLSPDFDLFNGPLMSQKGPGRPAVLRVAGTHQYPKPFANCYRQRKVLVVEDVSKRLGEEEHTLCKSGRKALQQKAFSSGQRPELKGVTRTEKCRQLAEETSLPYCFPVFLDRFFFYLLREQSKKLVYPVGRLNCRIERSSTASSLGNPRRSCMLHTGMLPKPHPTNSEHQ